MTLVVENLCVKISGQKLFAPVSFIVEEGEVLVIMGASGSGKTSLLSAIAGDFPAHILVQGTIWLNGRNLALLRPEQRKIGRLFQDDLLFPHLSVGENVLFGMPRGNASDRRTAMLNALHDIELDGFEQRGPHTLSGGQRSRVALMRALAARPEAMLLDEPFSKLDRNLRKSIRDFTCDHLRFHNIPTVLVTHDIEDVPQGAKLIYV
jgi:putative thiamine transport system ATP-binding protein